MNERLTTQDLINLLAEKHGMERKDAQAFVKEFFLLIEQALEADKYVKIKGLGTFKLTDVESRESINVHTGERFEIPGYTKVSFTPDPALKDIINKPFSHFETVVLNEDTVLEDTPIEEETEEDVTENMDERQEKIEEEAPAASETEEIAMIEEVETREKEAVVEQPAPQNREQEELSAENIIARELLKMEDTKPNAVVTPSPEELLEKPVKEKSPIPYLITIIIIVLLLCGGAILFIYFPDLFSSSPKEEITENALAPTSTLVPDTLEKSISFAETATEPEVKKEEEKVPVDAPVSKEKAKETSSQEKNVSKTSSPVTPDSTTYEIKGTKTTYTIKEGETLTKVALRFYGTKSLWPYIVKHNKGIIKNPDNVPFGTKIKIPELVKK